VLYLASPYSHPSTLIRHYRYVDVRKATAKLMLRGEIVYSPIVHGHSLSVERDLPETHEFWMHHCLGMLSRAKRLAVLTLDGWDKSIGVRAEMDWWEANRKHPVQFIDAGEMLP
jgi:hypothetical protein